MTAWATWELPGVILLPLWQQMSVQSHTTASPQPLHHPAVLPTPAKVADLFSFQLAMLPLMC